MKLKALLFLVLAAVLPLSAPHSAQARADVSFDYFYDALLPYGEWIEVEGHGLCWRPVDVGADWTPYADGYWAFTDAGWTWVGYEEFAGIVYHYGRWLQVEDEGWCWKPDYEWGPGWVSWRNSDDYIGWAPLPPRAYWQPEIGISTWVDTVADIGPAYYSFCRVRDFGAPVLRAVIISRTRNVTIIRNTVNITNITYNSYGSSPVIYNGGPSYTFISSRCERPIPTLKLVRRTHFDTPDFHGGPGRFSPNARTVGNQLFVNAPNVAPPERPAFFHEKVRKTFAADKVTNGWAGVKDAKVRDDLRGRFKRETNGLTPYTAPAKAVAAADLKVVPVQADANAVPPGFAGRGPRGKGERPPPAVTGNPVVPGPPASVVAEPSTPMKEDGTPGKVGAVSTDPTPPGDPRNAAKKEHGKKGDAQVPPVVTGVPLQPANVVIEPPKPMKEDGTPGKVGAVSTDPTPPGDPRNAAKKEHGKKGDAQVPPVVTGVPLQPFNPGADGKPPRKGQGVTVVPNTDKPAVPDVPVVVEPREGRGPKPAKVVEQPPTTDPAAAQVTEAARAAREQAASQQKMEADKLRTAQDDLEKTKAEQQRMTRQRDAEAAGAATRNQQQAEAAASERTKMQQQKMELEKTRATQGEADKARTEQERTLRQGEAEALRQKQAAAAGAASAEKDKMQAQQQQRAAQAEREKLAAEQERITRQRDADTNAAARQKQLEAQRQAEMKRQQTDAQAQELQRRQQDQLAGQRKQMQIEQQRAAQDTAKQQAADNARAQQLQQQRAAQEAAKQQAMEQRRQQQAEQQRAAQDAAKQQAMEQRRQQQMDQQRAAQDAAKQQAAEQQHRAMDAQREQAARQQLDAQRAAQQQQAQQQAAQQQAAQQQAAQQQAAQQQAAPQAAQRGGKEKDKDKDKEKGR